ncbi:MAG: tRNA lysidine(34) synthetase TilS [Pseudomonadota bacterium]
MTGADTTLVSDVRTALRGAGALDPGEICLVAVSGGRDSMVLLDVCGEIGETEGAFVVGTVDHGLRPFGAETGLVERLCAARRIPWRLEGLEPDLRERARAQGRSLEDQARRERYAALDRLADALGATRILTAHTVEDQAETVLLRLLRGAGPLGLAGILPARGPRVLRPLLGVSRGAVAARAEARRLPWVRDPGNEDSTLRRSRLRGLLPALEAAAPGAATVLARDAAVAADHAAGLRAWALEHFCLGVDASLPLMLSLERVGRGPAARVRLHALLRALGLAHRLERGHFEILEDLVVGAEGRSADLPDGLHASKRGDHLHLGTVPEASRRQVLEIPGPGRHASPVGVLEVTTEGPVDPVTDPQVEVLFDQGAVRFPLRLRPPRSGERFEPFGFKGHTRLVSDLLSEEKIPRHARGLPRILEDGDGRALWIAGCRRGSVAVLGPDTAAVLRVRLVED